MRRAVLILLAIASLTAEWARADSDDVTGLIDVAVYSLNDDYLSFTVHRPRIPRFYVMREVICQVDLMTRNALQVEKTFELTQVEPHFFALDINDAVLYFPHGVSAVIKVHAKCIANPVYGVKRVSGSFGYSTGLIKLPGKSETEIVIAKPLNSEEKPPQMSLGRADLPASWDSAWHKSQQPSPSEPTDPVLRQFLANLGSKRLAEPKGDAVKLNLVRQSDPSFPDAVQSAVNLSKPPDATLLTARPVLKKDG